MTSASVLPAYAGMIRRRQPPHGGLPGAPRVCGDDPWNTAKSISAQQCSPRMRG